jgi:dolichol-phosphate mannosyltransferase
MLTFTLVPLSVFILHSIWHEPKLNWTGPVWLAILPLLGMDMGRGGQGLAGRLANFGRALWRPTVMVALLVYGGGMYWIVLGTPGAAQMRHMQLPVAWEEMGEEVEAIEDRIKLETGQELIIIGMDKLFISSEVSFYDSDGDGPAEVSGRHLVGRTSLMWNRWGSPTAALGQNVLMISFDRGHLERSSLAEHFRGLGEIVREDVKKGSRVPGRFYYRVGRGYRG